jgi:hypothetical protein
MPLTEKGQKIKGAMENKYGPEKGEKVFYASKNKGNITGVDADFPEKVRNFSDMCDSLVKRMDAFEARQHQRKPEDVKPRTKDFMQPSNPHPKKVDG